MTAYVFVVDALNFCFWPNQTTPGFEYDNMTTNLANILKTDPDFFTPKRLATVDQAFITEKVYDNKKDFALLDERTRLVQQLGKVL